MVAHAQILMSVLIIKDKFVQVELVDAHQKHFGIIQTGNFYARKFFHTAKIYESYFENIHKNPLKVPILSRKLSNFQIYLYLNLNLANNKKILNMRILIK